jgi:hypothetical protein
MESATRITEDRIRRHALKLWEQHGSPAGYEAEFWGQAERELRAEGSAKAETTNAETARSGSGSDGCVYRKPHSIEAAGESRKLIG